MGLLQKCPQGAQWISGSLPSQIADLAGMHSENVITWLNWCWTTFLIASSICSRRKKSVFFLFFFFDLTSTLPHCYFYSSILLLLFLGKIKNSKIPRQKIVSSSQKPFQNFCFRMTIWGPCVLFIHTFYYCLWSHAFLTESSKASFFESHENLNSSIITIKVCEKGFVQTKRLFQLELTSCSGKRFHI